MAANGIGWHDNIQKTSSYAPLGELGGMAVSIDRDHTSKPVFKAGVMGKELATRFETMDAGKDAAEIMARQLLLDALKERDEAAAERMGCPMPTLTPAPAPATEEIQLAPIIRKRVIVPPDPCIKSNGLFAAFKEHK